MNKPGTKRLETERLVLRRIEEQDCTQMFHSWASRGECCKYFPFHTVTDLEFYRNKVLKWIQEYESGTCFRWLIEWKETKAAVGIINLGNVEESCLSAETSYILSPGFWNKGIMTEALRGVLDYAFDEVGLNRIQADVFQGNVALECVLKKCGMKFEGVAREKYCKDDIFIDCLQYAILKKDRQSCCGKETCGYGINEKEGLLSHLEELHTTESGIVRIKRNLSLEIEDVLEWCKAKITEPDAVITRRGKNWYVNADKCIITVNAHSNTIITAHLKDCRRPLH